MWLFQDILRDVLINLIAGIIIFLAGLRWKLIRSYLSRERAAFRRVFGAKAAEAGIVTVTLDAYRDIRLLPERVQELVGATSAETSAPQARRFFKRFPDGHWTAFPGAYGDILAYCSARAAIYLIESFSAVGIMVRVASDLEVASQWSGTYVNIGSSATNIKTNDIKQLAENQWLLDDLEGFAFRDGQKELIEERLDKGIILKLPNPYFRGYSVLVCAGLGESGTSGAARFLAREWRMLAKRFGENAFLVLIGVTRGADESGREIRAMGKETIRWHLRSFLRFKKRPGSARKETPYIDYF